ncbi:recombinase family protein [Streptomyces sp. WI04-05B]|uniref:recombinase family protein n=1 Tax=Streptomyces TaxID=1883 RepID=UPI0029A3E303|nr:MULTISPECIES: recombinase family protein [unclassified Streptomyces]MDX2546906.1 recombinase family protein [Streptomyces sp. WI04-05B]MDX2589291.1 recombinase family protein [Streptomyces sp. WI04-05A]
MHQVLTNPDNSELQAILDEIGVVFQVPSPGQLRAVAYLRVSTEDQKKGYGLSYTLKRVLKHLAKKGHALVGIYADGGFSGSLEAHERPDLARLMEAGRRRDTPFDLVCVAEARAIGRRDRAFWPWVWELEDLGVYTSVVKGDYDNSTAEGRSRMRKDADKAEDERETIRDRTQGGLQEKAEDGGYTGGFVPTGYEVLNQGVKGESRLGLKAADLPTLRRGRKVFVQQLNWSDTAAILNGEGLFTKSGKRWTGENLQHVLLGDAVLRSRIVFRKTSKAKLDRDGNPMYGESVVIPLPPVFTPEEVAELEAAVDLAKKGPPVSRGRVYLLSGRMISLCGHHYSGHLSNSRTAGYRCNGSASAGGPGCTCNFLEAEVTEAAMWSTFSAALGDKERLRKVASDWISINQGKNIDHAERIADLEKRITALRRAKNLTMSMAIREAIAEGASDADAEQAAAAAVRSMNRELTSMERLKAETAEGQAECEAAGHRARDLMEMVERARTQLVGNLSPTQKRRLLELLDTTVTVTEDAPKGRQGTPCTLAAWFRERERPVPVLTDDGWESVAHLFPRLRKSEPRTVVEALLHKACTGLQWSQMPDVYGPQTLIRNHWNRWSGNGLWEQAMGVLTDAEGRDAFRPWRAPSMSIRTWVIPELLLGAEQNSRSSVNRASIRVLFKFPIELAT